ncbi:Lrp/AsnC family transcriptional regulator [Paenactinomyces guangxiensis]|uniref:Lrp/AsnC family transcriptional regulator n=1 Tax=Paenactinomyces guangxiensis TaxID=1490290 RepID=A0A7W1WQS2_9BACL|nr:Lrp/AsnC family transcriptional regulator [Paenactinomyces guangxiensis]MBA4494325.1 Lrp/AsnC family transcriptional regulator [Paenactinomyces guangxiensis]MBH8590820.1 Lrp/AsnC family transcriptional regulator [Paenactinomyces guangxiensis]
MEKKTGGKGNGYTLDEVDKAIIEYLQKDGRCSYTEIAEELKVTVGTVRNRVQRLMENQILKIVGVVDPFKTGMATVAMLGLKVRLNKLDEIIKALEKIPEVRFVAVSTGTFDMFIEIITSSTEEFYRILTTELSNIEGIEATDSSMLLKIHKQSYDWGVQ